MGFFVTIVARWRRSQRKRKKEEEFIHRTTIVNWFNKRFWFTFWSNLTFVTIVEGHFLVKKKRFESLEIFSILISRIFVNTCVVLYSKQIIRYLFFSRNFHAKKNQTATIRRKCLSSWREFTRSRIIKSYRRMPEISTLLVFFSSRIRNLFIMDSERNRNRAHHDSSLR